MADVVIDLAPWPRTRYWCACGAGVLVLALFLGWSVGWWHGVAAFVIFALVGVAVDRWARPSDLIRRIEVDATQVTFHRASPTVTRIARDEITAWHIAPGVGERSVLHLQVVDPERHQELWNLGAVADDGIRLPLAGADAAAQEHLRELTTLAG